MRLTNLWSSIVSKVFATANHIMFIKCQKKILGKINNNSYIIKEANSDLQAGFASRYDAYS